MTHESDNTHSINGRDDLAENRTMQEFEDLQEEFETFEALCEQFARTMPAPRRALKQRIMDAIAALPRNDQEPEAPMEAPSEIPAEIPSQFTIRMNEGTWVEVLPGIETKDLFKDPDTGRTTYMARLAPGAVYPDHRHHGVEELIMLEGDLFIGGELLHPGDYLAALPNTTHHEVYSPSGCLCVVSSMMNDEFI